MVTTLSERPSAVDNAKTVVRLRPEWTGDALWAVGSQGRALVPRSAAAPHAAQIALAEMLVEAMPVGAVDRLAAETSGHAYLVRLLLFPLNELLAVAAAAGRTGLRSYDTVELVPGWPHETLWPLLLPALQAAEREGRLASLLPEEVRAGLCRLRLTRAHRGGFFTSFLVAAYVLALVVDTLRRVRPGGARVDPKPVLLRTYGQDWTSRENPAQRLRRIDFVVDDDELPRSAVAIWAEANVSRSHREAVQGLGCDVVGQREIRLSMRQGIRALRLVLSLAATLASLRGKAVLWYRALGQVVRAAIIWEGAARAYRPKVFLTLNDFLPASVIRNDVLRKHGCTTVYYQHSSGSYDHVTGELAQSILHPYLHYGAVAAWGPMHARFFLGHTDFAREAWDVGSLFSENVRLVEADAVAVARYEAELRPLVDTPIDRYVRSVGVFDGSLTGHEPLVRAWVAFHRGLAALAERLPDVLFLVKPKRDLDGLAVVVGADGERVLDDLRRRPNVALLPASFETDALLALTDLTIGLPFTSVVVEAMGAGKPAVYFDAARQYPEASWHGIPGLVCDTLDDLERRARELLWQVSRDEYRVYLERYASDVEGHFDGLGMTRLRRRLCGIALGQAEARGDVGAISARGGPSAAASTRCTDRL